MKSNRAFHAARAAKQDEFYTSFADIAKELGYYTKADDGSFKGKTVLCNCGDNPSNFYRYFSLGFERLGLRKLIATGYDKDCTSTVVIRDGHHNKEDTLSEGGDFRSQESIALLEEADVVVTNPPFSLFREYLQQLVEYRKKFLVVGPVSAIAYNQVFPLLMSRQIRLGVTQPKKFVVPDHHGTRSAGGGRDEKGTNWRGLGDVYWFTNLEPDHHNKELRLWHIYTPALYPKYENCDAIEVSRYDRIPMDYARVMGVPITFLPKLNHDQFQVVGLLRPFLRNSDGTLREMYFRLLIRNRRPRLVSK